MKDIKSGLIIRLIRDSLINYKLVSGLNALGLDADDYNLYLSDAIFSLMGFEQKDESEKAFEKIYMPLAEKVKEIDFSKSTTKLNTLTMEIYYKLLGAKKLLEKKG